jgi:phenylalanyl-tRNA synthetase alpha chain
MNVDEIVAEALGVFAGIDDADALEGAKARYLGKTGALTELRKTLGKMPPEERPAMGVRFNEAKDRIEDALRARRETIQSNKLEARLKEEALDVTLPGRGPGVGALHPVTRTLDRIERALPLAGI